MRKEQRERAAWRFDPRFLQRLRDFVASQDLQITQTQVLERGASDFMDKQEAESKRSARR